MASKGAKHSTTDDHHRQEAPAPGNEAVEVVETVDHRKTAGQEEPTTEPVEIVHEHPKPNEDEAGGGRNNKPSSKEKVTVAGKKALAGAAKAVNRTVELAKEAVSGDKNKDGDEEKETGDVGNE